MIGTGAGSLRSPMTQLRHWPCTAALVFMLFSAPTKVLHFQQPLRCRRRSLGADMRRREFITHARRRGGGVAAYGAGAAAGANAAYRRTSARDRGRCGISVRLAAFHRTAATRAGPTAATCGSTPAGLRAMSPRFAIRGGIGRARAGGHPGLWWLGRGTGAQVTRTVPIVFPDVVDPVGGGFVASLARPGGNATGFASFEYGISGKWLELLKEIAPSVTRVAVLRDPTIARHRPVRRHPGHGAVA